MMAGKCITREPEISKMTKKKGASNVWRSISKVVTTLTKGAKINVYNRNDRLFWRDKWISDSPLLERVTQQISMADSFKRVINYRDIYRGWKWEEMASLLSPDIANQLSNSLVRQDEDDKDRLS